MWKVTVQFVSKDSPEIRSIGLVFAAADSAAARIAAHDWCRMRQVAWFRIGDPKPLE